MITYRYLSDGTKVSAEAVLEPEIDEGNGITPATQGVVCTADTGLYGSEHDNRYRYAGKEENRISYSGKAMDALKQFYQDKTSVKLIINKCY